MSHVARGLSLEPATRLNPIEIAVDVELQQDRRMIRRSAGRCGIDPAEPKFRQIEFVDNDIDYANRIVLADPVFQAFRKQRLRTRSVPSTKRLIRSPANRVGIIPRESLPAARFHTARVISRINRA